ncbi:MAG: DNA cytosine methyltransferase [Fibrobacter sp.]|nr:DNA cytosine methyltransferase [Fibrobacter sp.]
MMKIKTVGSICSGIEAASVAWKPFGVAFTWFSEIAPFPSQVLKEKYPSVQNIGDMNRIPELLLKKKIEAPDLICGGTPCQAFSLAGSQKGLNDERGNLTLKFVDIINANDKVREKNGLDKCCVFWENVEGVLTDKTNAFGCLIASLAGLKSIDGVKKWPTAGLLEGPERNVAWRVLDAKFFGLPQQRRRLYVLAGGNDFHPEKVLFENASGAKADYPEFPLSFKKDGHQFEIFRSYSDCLYAAYGTKWNGNAAAYNGSLFVVQDNRLRRLSPLECERMMGFPDDYTNIKDAKKTNRYQAVGNSWAVPVVRWIGNRLINESVSKFVLNSENAVCEKIDGKSRFFRFDSEKLEMPGRQRINVSAMPTNCSFASMQDIVSPEAPSDVYISPVGCHGILRRQQERNISINQRLKKVLERESKKMSLDEIERKSLVQKRGRRGMVA